MNIYKELDTLIKDRCMEKDTDLFNEGAMIVNENSYLQLRDEINECKLVSEDGTLEIDQLSPIAQDCVREWESLIEAKAHQDYINYAEQPEDF